MPEYAPCPNCSGTRARQVSFTWWGGLLGPSLLTHVKCEDCGTAYNGKTGRSNTPGIIVYSVVAGGLALVLLFLVLLLMAK
jgi:hypothetical protein